MKKRLSFKTLICGQKKKDCFRICRKVNDFWIEYPSLVVNICDVSRSPMSDHRYPPPLRHVADQRPLILDSRHFLGWRTDYQCSPILTLMYTSIFDIQQASSHLDPVTPHEARQLRLDKLLSGCWLLNLTNGAAVADTRIHCTQSNI